VPEKDLGLIVAANYDLTPMDELYKGVLDIVLGHEPEMPRRWIALAFAEALFSDGLEAAKTRYRELESTAREEYVFDPDQLVYLAYLVMQDGHAEAAIDVLRFNTELYPEHLDSYDYLAGAYAARGDTAAAIDVYTRVLEIDPDNENARRMLTDLGVSPD
jgi:tetratricopeptide (TPR) repeat protein